MPEAEKLRDMPAAKGAAAVWLAEGFTDHNAAAMILAGLGALLGHCFPVWLRFKGGKGVATFLGSVLGISAGLVLVLVVTWLVVVILFGYVGLASMAAAVAVAVAVAMRADSPRALLAFAVLAALLIIYTHRGNIERMARGCEARARRLWLFGLRRERG